MNLKEPQTSQGASRPDARGMGGRGDRVLFFSLSLLLSSLELSDTNVYEPYIRALLGTGSHFCHVVVLKLTPSQGAGGRGAHKKHPPS